MLQFDLRVKLGKFWLNESQNSLSLGGFGSTPQLWKQKTLGQKKASDKRICRRQFYM